MIIKQGARNFKVDVIQLSWMLLVLNPSLPMATQLEARLRKKAEQLNARLGKSCSFELRLEVYNTYKSDNEKEQRINVEVI